jgi:hypothetical protein
MRSGGRVGVTCCILHQKTWGHVLQTMFVLQMASNVVPQECVSSTYAHAITIYKRYLDHPPPLIPLSKLVQC